MKGRPLYQGTLLKLLAEYRDDYQAILARALKEGPIEGVRKDPKEIFNRNFAIAMAEGTIRGGIYRTIEVVSSLFEIKNAKKLIDLGGGHGLYAIAFAQINLNLEAVVFDLPKAIEVAREFIDQYEMEGRVKVDAGNFEVDDIGTDWDIIFASDALYRISRPIDVFKKIYGSLSKGGIFISKHWMMNEDRASPPASVFWDLTMSLRKMDGGRFHVYSKKEYVELLKMVGFSNLEVIDISTTSGPSVIVVARR